jgi:WD40 repeat protein
MFAVQGHIQPIYCCIFDRTGTRIITGSDDFLVKIWNADTGWLIHTLRGHSSVIVDIAVNTENTLVAAASLDSTVRVWNLATAEPVAVLLGPITGRAEFKGFTGVAFLPGPIPNLRYLLALGVDGNLRLWKYDLDNLEFSKEPLLFPCKTRVKDELRSYSFDFTGTRFSVGSMDGLIRVFAIDPDSGEIRGPTVLGHEWGTGHKSHVTSLSYSNEGGRILSGSLDGTVRIWKFVGEMFKAGRWEEVVGGLTQRSRVESFLLGAHGVSFLQSTFRSM